MEKHPSVDRRVPLIVDCDETCLNSISVECMDLADDLNPFLTESIERAAEILHENKERLSMLIISSEIGVSAATTITEIAFQIIPGIPVVLIAGRDIDQFTDNDLRRMMVMKTVPRPFSYKESMKSLMSRDLALRIFGGKVDNDFFAVNVEAIPAAQETEADLYVKIRQNRYVLVVRAGSSLGEDRMKRYVGKGLTKFYRVRGGSSEAA